MRKHLPKLLGLFALMLLLVIPEASHAFSTTNGAEFNSLWTKVQEWITGIPGLIASVAVVAMGIFRAYQSGNFFWFFGSLLVAIVLLLLPTIVTGMGFVY